MLKLELVGWSDLERSRTATRRGSDESMDIAGVVAVVHAFSSEPRRLEVSA